MNAYKYPWPPMLECDKFPLDNDMCITSQAEAHKEKEQVQKNTEKKSKGKEITLFCILYLHIEFKPEEINLTRPRF